MVKMRKFCSLGLVQYYDGIFIILWFHLCQLSHCLKCHECTDIEGFEGFESSCGRPSDPGPLKEGFAGCLKIDIVSEVTTNYVIRAGYLNPQVLGRPLSCYHAEPGFIVHAYIERIKFATLISCLACDDQDGCNAANPRVTGSGQRVMMIIFVFVSLAFAGG